MTYYNHVYLRDVRMKVCKKTAVMEQLRPTHYESDDTPKEWKYYTSLKLPLKPDHAESLREKYNLPDNVVNQLKGEPPI